MQYVPAEEASCGSVRGQRNIIDILVNVGNGGKIEIF